MKKTVGTYGLGPHAVELVLDFSTDCGYFSTSYKNGLSRIEVGASQQWEYTVQTLMHEALEMALTNVRGRFRYAPDTACGSDSYVFHFDHNQMSEAAARVGSFISECLPAMGKVYNKFQKAKR